jgi:hypothetical protein
MSSLGVMGRSSATEDPVRLRARAQALRLLAMRLEVTPATTLHRYAGPDTWVGATPQACLDELGRLPHDLTACVDELGLAARTLERRADDAELLRWLRSGAPS